MSQFELKLSEEQYNELAQFWHEYTLLGPKNGEPFSAFDFCAWMDSDPDENPVYGLPEIAAFLAEKERREGTELAQEDKEPPDLVAEMYHRIESPGYNEVDKDDPLYVYPDEEDED